MSGPRPGELDIRFRALDAAGAVVLDLDATPGAYEIVTYEEIGITWRRQIETSPFVDGNVEAASVRESSTIALAVRVLAPTGRVLNERRAALTDAVAGQPRWLAEVTLQGVRAAWRASRADWTISSDRSELASSPLRRVVTITIPVQPSRSIVYL